MLSTTDNFNPSSRQTGGSAPIRLECFIATTVYGDRNPPQVEKLRQIRDNHLTKTNLGRKVIDIYYNQIGQRSADLISKRLPFMTPAIRKGLDFIISIYEPKENNS